MTNTKKRLLFSVTLKDCRVDTFRCPGKGGQNVNKLETGVRITHTASGAVGHSCDERKQGQNKKLAWRRMLETKEFKLWHKLTVAELLTGKSVDELVEETMDVKNLRVEIRTSAGWQVVPVNAELPQ